jgi:flagellar hook-associated protein 1 FlgK
MLTQTLNNALSGLRVNQQSLAVISQNIANANNEDYTRQQVSQESVNIGGEIGAGVRIKEVSRVVDEFIAKTVVIRGSDVARAGTVKEYYEQAQLYFGTPGSNNSIPSYMDKFFNNLNTLQNNPKNASVKVAVVSAAKDLADEVSTLAKNIEALRFQADTGIGESVKSINFNLKQLKSLNLAMLSASRNGTSTSGLTDQMVVALKNISSEMDINYKFADDGTVSVNTAEGYQLLAGGQLYELKYTPSTSVEDFYGNLDLGPIEIYSVDTDGEVSTEPSAVLVTSGFEETVTSSIKSGKIAGYLELRDELFPDILSQLDSLAANLRDAMNEIHNQGTAFPPPNKLTGDRLVDPTSAQYWDGSVRIAMLNSNGIPITSPYASDIADGIGFEPLTIDLNSLSDGNGVGKPTFQTIIDEINQHYGAPQPRVKLGPLTDIKLAAKDDSFDGTAGGTFDFNLDISNFGAQNASVVVTGATINGSATITTSLPTTAATFEAGSRSRGIDFTADFSAGTLTSYTVALTIQVTAADGTISTDTISYTLNEASEDLMNKRIHPASVSGSGNATLETPSSTDAFLTAKLVDANGVEITKDPTTGDYTQEGYLVIEGVTSSYRIAIDELDSKELGDAANGLDASNKGFSH